MLTRPDQGPLAPVDDEHLERLWLLQLLADGRSDRTIQNYLTGLRAFRRFLGGRHLLDATEQDVRDYWRYLEQRGLAPQTRNLRLTALRGFYSFLEDEGLLLRSPARRLRPVRRRAAAPRFLVPEEVRALRQAIPDTPRGRRDRALIELGLSSLRVSEAVALRVDDLFLARQQVRLVGKGGDQGLQIITPEAVGALEAWLQTRAWLLGKLRQPVSSVFFRVPKWAAPLKTAPRPMHYFSAERVFRGYCHAAGIALPPRRSFHVLRHTAGVRLADQGVPLQFIQDLFRHRRPETTRVYTQVSPVRLTEVVNGYLRF